MSEFWVWFVLGFVSTLVLLMALRYDKRNSIDYAVVVALLPSAFSKTLR